MNITTIQRFSIHDGPGIRTTVFLKGCSLNCFWCHNPETIRVGQELRFIPERCVSCGRCTAVCPAHTRYMEPGCLKCLACADACPAEAICRVLRKMTEEELAGELLKDMAYYEQSGGGVTFSGGEPLLQSAAIAKIIPHLKKRGVNVAIDTAGNVPWENIERIVNDIDLFLYDIKGYEESKHIRATGASNTRIIDNLRRIGKLNVPLWIRIPLVRDLNDADEEINGIASILRKLACVKLVEILPCHRLGEGKYRQLFREPPTAKPPTEDRMKMIKDILGKSGLPIKE